MGRLHERCEVYLWSISESGEALLLPGEWLCHSHLFFNNRVTCWRSVRQPYRPRSPVSPARRRRSLAQAFASCGCLISPSRLDRRSGGVRVLRTCGGSVPVTHRVPATYVASAMSRADVGRIGKTCFSPRASLKAWREGSRRERWRAAGTNTQWRTETKTGLPVSRQSRCVKCCCAKR